VFDVAQDWNRPFIVRTPLADATATGTRFGVSVENSVTTTVAEGTVEIRARGQPSGPVVTLQAGKELEILTADSLAKPVDVDAQRVLEWSTGWITFGGETISQAVAEFNRRSPLRISIEDPSIVAGRKIYGRFRFDLPHSFAWSIAQHSGDITVFEDTSANVLRVRRAAMPKPLEGESR
jgi:transmembrane sensor